MEIRQKANGNATETKQLNYKLGSEKYVKNYMERIKSKDKNLIKGCPPCSLDSFLDKSSIIGIGRRIRNWLKSREYNIQSFCQREAKSQS